MCMLDRRLQILLDEGRYQRISSLAKARGVSVATVVREAIDHGLPAEPARLLLSAEPMPAPRPETLRGELEELRGRYG